MEKPQEESLWQEEFPTAAQHEDAALKTVIRFFADGRHNGTKGTN